MLKFTVNKTHDDNYEVLMVNHKGGRKAHLPRRICICTHADDANNIAEAMELHEATDIAPRRSEYYAREERDDRR